MKIKVTQKQFDLIVKGYRIGGFVLIVGTLATFSLLIGKLLEFVTMFLAYFLTKGKYRMQWHSSSMKQCLMLSLVLFSLAVCSCLPTQISVIFAGCMGIVMSYLSYRAGYVQLLLRDYAYIEPRYNELVEQHNKSIAFKVKGSSAEELTQRCKEKGLSGNATEFCVRAFTNHYGKYYSDQELADHYSIELQSAKNKKYNYRKRLES